MAALIQEREAAACEIERLRGERETYVSTDAAESPRQSKATKQRSNLSSELPAFSAGSLLRLKTVCAFLGISRSTIYKLISDGAFHVPSM
jgi:excisionase family DNA binding protein